MAERTSRSYGGWRPPHVVLPVRGLASGKSRLSAILDPAQREAINRWLLGRTLEVVGAWLGRLDTCVVVSACERVLGIARESGAIALAEGLPGGLNAAAALGAAHAVRCDASSLLVLPCDLPRLTPRALHALLGNMGEADVAIAPDKRNSGTNAILLGRGGHFDFHFGERSFTLHCEAAAARGTQVAVHRSAALAFDVDTPDDYARWRLEARAGECDFPDGIVRTRSALEE